MKIQSYRQSKAMCIHYSISMERRYPRAGKTTLSLLKNAESSAKVLTEMLPIFNQGRKQWHANAWQFQEGDWGMPILASTNVGHQLI